MNFCLPALCYTPKDSYSNVCVCVCVMWPKSDIILR